MKNTTDKNLFLNCGYTIKQALLKTNACYLIKLQQKLFTKLL